MHRYLRALGLGCAIFAAAGCTVVLGQALAAMFVVHALSSMLEQFVG